MTPPAGKAYFLFVGFAALVACPADVERASSNGARCGDGRLELGEACDDGNDVRGDGCGACTPEPGYACDTAAPSICRAVCGDGIWVPPEECDDGGLMGGDGCTSECRVRLGWACAADGPGQRSRCSPRCGDGVRMASEGCDDENTVAGDGCGPDCQAEVGWTCGEDASTPCSEVCGDHRVVGRETCDDGNQEAGDGCDPACVARAVWSPLFAPDASPVGRQLHSAVWTGARVLIWGGAQPASLGEGSSYDPTTGSWSTLSSAPIQPRFNHSATWTGAEMIVFGGQHNRSPMVLAQGAARYIPSSGRWEMLQAPGEPTPRYGHSAVWTGRELLIWGGHASNDLPTQGGARFDPSTMTWSPITEVGAPSARGFHTAVWTGVEMIVFGGSNGASALEGGAAYDPETDRWRPLSVLGAPSARYLHAAVWSGLEMIVFGGQTSSATLGSGAAYDPELDVWRPIAEQGAPGPRAEATAVWTGSRLVIWGGARFGGEPYRLLDDGAVYIPAVDAWSPLTRENAPRARLGNASLWVGSGVFVWGGYIGPPHHVAADGGLFDPRQGTWRSISGRNAPPAPRFGHRAVWSGQRMLVWGGAGYWGPLDSGAIYDPESVRWTATPSVGAPSPRVHHSAVWASGRMIVFGGEDGTLSLGDGAMYSEGEDTWIPLPSEDAPSPRSNHTAIWTGAEMIVWGGFERVTAEYGNYLASGATFDPILRSWRSLPSTGAPPPRTRHTAVWTGAEMIIFGGVRSGGASGGRYRPSDGTWRPLERTGMPSSRFSHSAIWTGREMIIWGGLEIDDEQNVVRAVSDGARFDPEQGVWTAISAVGAPTPRMNHATVWTGAEMIVWGGRPSQQAPPLGDGARYRPDLDRWEKVTEEGSLAPRRDHSAVWTGSSMIVFGGHDGGLRGDGARFDL